jgi:hypothetical protein
MMSPVLFIVFVCAIAGAVAWGLDLGVAAYALSFWHYFLYWLGYLFCAIPLAAFKREAIMMKSVAMGVLAWAFLSGAPDLLSVTVMTLGFALNGYAASIMGSDRCYYGYEIGGLPGLRITAFPYSITAHPMLIGNIVAFAGALINPDFREHWWPLAMMHVGMNIGLLIMETTLRAGSSGARCIRVRWLIGLVISLYGAAIGYAAHAQHGPLMGSAVGLCVCAYAFALFFLSSKGTDTSGARQTGATGSLT